jgi:hypothetical protein
MVLKDTGIQYVDVEAKIVRKTLIPTVLCLLYDFFPLNNYRM